MLKTSTNALGAISRIIALATALSAGGAHAEKKSTLKIVLPGDERSVDLVTELEGRLDTLERQRLEERIYTLERKLIDLEGQLYHRTSTAIDKRYSHGAPEQASMGSPEPLWSCTLTTPWETHIADGKNKEQARGRVLQNCGNGPGCKPEKVTCGS